MVPTLADLWRARYLSVEVSFSIEDANPSSFNVIDFLLFDLSNS